MKKIKRIFPVYVVVSIVLIIIAGGIFWLVLARNKSAPAAPSVAMVSALPAVSATVTAEASWPKNQTITVPILMYHHIGPLPPNADATRKNLTISEQNFSKQMGEIKTAGFTPLTLSQMYSDIAENQLPKKSIVLTFDDGYSDNYQYALPILQSYGYKATFFIISGKIGHTEGPNSYMDETQVAGLAKAGNEIGSHTVTHPDLTVISAAKAKTEIDQSKSDLERITGQTIISFCYPSGKFNPAVEADVRSAGYKVAVATTSGAPFSTDKPFEIPRYRMNPTADLAGLLKKTP